MKVCATCGSRLGRSNTTGHCRKHASAIVAQRPEYRAAQLAGVRRSMADPARIETMRRLARQNGTSESATAKRRETARRIKLWESGHAALQGNTDARVKAGQRRTATVLAHIPRERRADYRHLVRSKGFTAAEAQAIILKQHEDELARFRRQIGAERAQ